MVKNSIIRNPVNINVRISKTPINSCPVSAWAWHILVINLFAGLVGA